MLIVADSGSTKCDWLLLDRAAGTPFSTAGLNPLLLSESELTERIAQSELSKIKTSISELNFYGAGCSTEDRVVKVEKVLRQFFSNAEVFVQSDLMGAVRACCQNDAGVVCILGTGSNATFFDGDTLVEGQPSLGYLLGDEGSGMHIGKRLLRDYFYGQMPEEFAKVLSDTYEMKKDDVLKELYEKAHPNAYLASFAKFASQPTIPYFSDLVKSCFREFIELHVLPFETTKAIPLHFVGSVAHYFESSLREIANEFGFSIGKIIQKPIFNLGEYHLNEKNAS